MKTSKVSGTLFYVAAIFFYLATIIHFASADRSLVVIYLALGSTFLCLGELPESEMKEIKLFDTLPAELTYPQTSPQLYAEAEKVMKGM